MNPTLSCGVGDCAEACGICDDGNDCTEDVCEDGVCAVAAIDELFCFIGDSCLPSAAELPGDPCSTCQPEKSQVDWTSRPDGFPCGDGKTCQAGMCQ